ncbi:Aste57867_9635 [Aphanomyces stellatus]|uniref:protein-serine/threonine phosphatase n=1 Tax=Aphanomyces stellatus TaxID=120398 RepID=A0A485KNP0_9STRA|nr:hypothetical protein As57867_009597 [Aphanomyces stellatus]VFT86514.1 Aste57867_9635 [Aphanomyces stellatus]
MGHCHSTENVTPPPRTASARRRMSAKMREKVAVPLRQAIPMPPTQVMEARGALAAEPLDMSPFHRKKAVSPAHNHLLLFVSPTDPILDDTDFLDAPDVVGTSIAVSIPPPAGPVRHIAALTVQNKSFKAHMEDACVVEPALGPLGLQFCAIYDGHAGSFVSNYLARHLHMDVAARVSSSVDIPTALVDSFAAMDAALEDMAADRCGSTAVVCAALGSCVTVANLGDSHCLHVTSTHVARVTTDHHVRNADEVTRIKDCRGIILNQRVSGVSKVTRALGQNEEKDFVISAPAIATLDVGDDGGCFVLMSDGVTDVLGDEEIAAHVRRGLEAGWSLSLVCRSLVDLCKLKRASDNMSIALLQIA